MKLALKAFESPRVQNLGDRLVPSARWLQQRGQQALDNRTLSTRMRTSAGDKRRRVCSKGRGANFAGRLPLGLLRPRPRRPPRRTRYQLQPPPPPRFRWKGRSQGYQHRRCLPRRPRVWALPRPRRGRRLRRGRIPQRAPRRRARPSCGGGDRLRKLACLQQPPSRQGGRPVRGLATSLALHRLLHRGPVGGPPRKPTRACAARRAEQPRRRGGPPPPLVGAAS